MTHPERSIIMIAIIGGAPLYEEKQSALGYSTRNGNPHGNEAAQTRQKAYTTRCREMFGVAMISEIPRNSEETQTISRPHTASRPKDRPAVRYRDHLDPKEHWLRGPINRVLQLLARISPGAGTLRVWLHRARGVKIGNGVWIGYDVILDSSVPGLIVIEDGASISMRVTVIAHFKESRGVKIERDAFVGPGVIILPNV
jgi:acetyltransferase-like isoleucine patch superfamily enzyme